jgi:hypothetical protein
MHCCHFDKEEGDQTLRARLRTARADLNYIDAPTLKGVAYALPASLSYFREYILENQCNIAIYDGAQHFIDPRIDMSKNTQAVTPSAGPTVGTRPGN